MLKLFPRNRYHILLPWLLSWYFTDTLEPKVNFHGGHTQGKHASGWCDLHARNVANHSGDQDILNHLDSHNVSESKITILKLSAWHFFSQDFDVNNAYCLGFFPVYAIDTTHKKFTTERLLSSFQFHHVNVTAKTFKFQNDS